MKLLQPYKATSLYVYVNSGSDSVGSLGTVVMEDFQGLFINIQEKPEYMTYTLKQGKSYNISARSNPHLKKKKKGSSFNDNTFLLIPWNV